MFIKRLFEISLSIFGLIIFSPLYLVIAILIKLLIPGPVFFRQKRMGWHGRQFIIYKFRTMVVNSESFEGTFDAGNNSRITKFGRILRQSKIDELPQLFNLLKGDMSIVGPRPEVKKWTEVYPDKWAIVHSVKPGITDNASIEFINEEKLLSQATDPDETYRNVILPRKIELNIEYVNNHTFMRDAEIILQTITIIFSRWKQN